MERDRNPGLFKKGEPQGYHGFIQALQPPQKASIPYVGFLEVHPVLGCRTRGLERQPCLLRAAPGSQVSPVLSCVINIFSRLRSRGISDF